MSALAGVAQDGPIEEHVGAQSVVASQRGCPWNLQLAPEAHQEPCRDRPIRQERRADARHIRELPEDGAEEPLRIDRRAEIAHVGGEDQVEIVQLLDAPNAGREPFLDRVEVDDRQLGVGGQVGGAHRHRGRCRDDQRAALAPQLQARVELVAERVDARVGDPDERHDDAAPVGRV